MFACGYGRCISFSLNNMIKNLKNININKNKREDVKSQCHYLSEKNFL